MKKSTIYNILGGLCTLPTLLFCFADVKLNPALVMVTAIALIFLMFASIDAEGKERNREEIRRRRQPK